MERSPRATRQQPKTMPWTNGWRSRRVFGQQLPVPSSQSRIESASLRRRIVPAVAAAPNTRRLRPGRTRTRRPDTVRAAEHNKPRSSCGAPSPPHKYGQDDQRLAFEGHAASTGLLCTPLTRRQ